MTGMSAIEWCDATWNPLTGCTRVTTGCDHCYAFALHDMRNAVYQRLGGRYPNGRAMPAQYAKPFSQIQLLPERLEQPLHIKQPKRFFVNSMSDLFHSDVPDDYIIQVFDVMRQAHWHTFQVLTKRAGRPRQLGWRLTWPDNVWMGVSIEEDRLTPRANALREVPAAVRFLSCEPLLGPLPSLKLDGIDWLITGGESGPRARPCHPEWVRDLRGRCRAAGVAFFHKQWGGRTPKAGGRTLDGRTWDDFPEPAERRVCEVCGQQFRLLEGYYEDKHEPTYSYCAQCCSW
ncbi:MAG TPA: phage Gp37/Gp68 family protein [Ktedonobacteraceae bacterium]|nr:phage Gp37/Gp68 family protein [Ktedonobacteraceae bacterium]